MNVEEKFFSNSGKMKQWFKALHSIFPQQYKLHLNKKDSNMLFNTIKKSLCRVSCSQTRTCNIDTTNHTLIKCSRIGDVLSILRRNNNSNLIFTYLNPLSVKITKWLNTLKQFVGNLPTNFLSVFDHFCGI